MDNKIIKSIKAQLELREVQLEEVIQAECSRWAKQLDGNIHSGYDEDGNTMNKDYLEDQIYALKIALSLELNKKKDQGDKDEDNCRIL